MGFENIVSKPGGSFKDVEAGVGVGVDVGGGGESRKLGAGIGAGVGLRASVGKMFIMEMSGLVAVEPGRRHDSSVLELESRFGCDTLRFFISSRLAIRRFSASSHRCQVGIQASTAASHCGFISSSVVDG
jgi:hypothetical protein